MTDTPHTGRQETVEGLLRAVLARYGDRFSPEQEQKVRSDIEELVDAAEILRGVPLVNADEPDLIFQATREDG